MWNDQWGYLLSKEPNTKNSYYILKINCMVRRKPSCCESWLVTETSSKAPWKICAWKSFRDAILFNEPKKGREDLFHITLRYLTMLRGLKNLIIWKLSSSRLDHYPLQIGCLRAIIQPIIEFPLFLLRDKSGKLWIALSLELQ